MTIMIAHAHGYRHIDIYLWFKWCPLFEKVNVVEINFSVCQVGERATGYGVSLLNSLFGTASKAALLQVHYVQTIFNEHYPLTISHGIGHTRIPIYPRPSYPPTLKLFIPILLQAASPAIDNGALDDGEDRGPSQGQNKKARIE